MRPYCERCNERGIDVLAFYPTDAPTRCPSCQDAYEEAASEPHYPTAGPSERERWEQAADCGRRR